MVKYFDYFLKKESLIKNGGKNIHDFGSEYVCAFLTKLFGKISFKIKTGISNAFRYEKDKRRLKMVFHLKEWAQPKNPVNFKCRELFSIVLKNNEHILRELKNPKPNIGCWRKQEIDNFENSLVISAQEM